MKKLLKKNKGITLVALVVTIVILLILAGISINMVLGENGIITKAKKAKKDTNDSQSAEISGLSKLDQFLNQYGEIEDITDQIDGLPAKKTHEELPDYIPIYTTTQLMDIATGKTNYEIKDLNNTTIGTYTMAADAKYALMNDLDFQKVSSAPIQGFKGEFEGNGCTITNLNVNDTSKEVYLRPGYEDTGIRKLSPAALFASVENGKVSNLAITDSNFKAEKFTAGAIVGEAKEVEIDNCYAKNNTYVLGEPDYGATGGIVGYSLGDNITIKNCKSIQVTSNKPSGFAGICGSAAGNVLFENCQVLGNNNTSKEAAAGIINCAGQDVTINNCRVQKLNAKYAGIIATATSTDRRRKQ